MKLRTFEGEHGRGEMTTDLPVSQNGEKDQLTTRFEKPLMAPKVSMDGKLITKKAKEKGGSDNLRNLHPFTGSEPREIRQISLEIIGRIFQYLSVESSPLVKCQKRQKWRRVSGISGNLIESRKRTTRDANGQKYSAV